MLCFVCNGTQFHNSVEQIEQEYQGRTLLVYTQVSKCNKCGWITLGANQANYLIRATAMTNKTETERLAIANAYLEYVSKLGCKLFQMDGNLSRLTTKNGEYIWVDCWENRKTTLKGEASDWVNSLRHGMGIRTFIQVLRDFVKTGKQLQPGIVKHWGYGEDTKTIIQKGQDLGIFAQYEEPTTK